MAGRVIIAPEYVSDLSGPLIFLAGPIQGAPLWQTQATAYLQQNAPQIHVASPRRLEERKFSPGEFTEAMYAEQVDWETFHLRQASVEGCILFWLANEAVHVCSRAYAQTTRFELAEWKMRHERDGVRLALGIEDGFTGHRYLKRRLSQDCPGIVIRSTLKETCEDAIRLARKG
jgi:hypothetical protein